MARYGDYETDRQLASRGMTTVFVAQRVAGSGPETAVVKVLQLPEELAHFEGETELPSKSDTSASASPERTSPRQQSDASPAAEGWVFISHSTTDKAKADAVCAALEQSGLRCWIAPRDILPGSNWAASILRAIGESRLMLMLLSEPANESAHIRREVERAVSRGVPIAPIRIQDIMPRDDLEYFLSASHWLDAISDPFEQHLPPIVEAIRARLAAIGHRPVADNARGQRTLGTAARALAEVPAEPRVAAAVSPRMTAGDDISATQSSVARAALEQFLDAAEAQRRAANVNRHWAGVYEMGGFPGGAFYITEHCRYSVQRCIEGGMKLDGSALYTITSGILDGLESFHRTAGRPHGDVEPSNVLLRADPREPVPDGVSLVALTDPLGRAQLTQRHTLASDLQDVGRLIYQLVEGPRTAAEIPTVVKPSPKWQALGSNWRRWVAMCTFMLSARTSSTLAVVLARERLSGLKPSGLRARRGLLGLTAAAATLAIAVPVVWFAMKGFSPASAGPGSDPDQSRNTQQIASNVDARPQTQDTLKQGTAVEPAADVPVLEQLAVAENRAFQVTLSAEQKPCDRVEGDCVTFTINSDRGGYVILLTRDSARKLDLLIPHPPISDEEDGHGEVPTPALEDGADPAEPLLEEIAAGTTQLPNETCNYYFPVGPPYGNTWTKVIVSTKPVEVVRDPITNEVLSLKIAGGRAATNLRDLLSLSEWATAETWFKTNGPAGSPDSVRSGEHVAPFLASRR